MFHDSATEIKVQPIRRRDLDRLLEILRASFKKEIEIGGFDIQRFEHTERLYRMTKFLMPILDFLHVDYPNILVATIGKVVVGEVHLVPLRKGVWTLDSLATDPAYTRRGVGYSLIKGAIEYITRKHGKKALSSIRTDNTPALKIAEKLGFIPYRKTIVLYHQMTTIPETTNSPNFAVRKFQPTDAEEAFKIIETTDATKTQASEMTPKNLQTTLLETLVNRALQAQSEKLIIGTQNKIAGYAHVTYTSPKEAARIQALDTISDANSQNLTETMLNHILNLLKEKNITKVTITIDEKRQDTIEILKKLGFAPIASFHEISKQLN